MLLGAALFHLAAAANGSQNKLLSLAFMSLVIKQTFINARPI